MKTPEKIISLPQGGGAIQGIGETFTPDLFTGTGNFSVPIALPSGRNGFQPSLNLQYSTGNSNDVFGLGWQLGVPDLTRKTSTGVPRYQDDSDVFVLSGTEDLVRISGDIPGIARYRPRTEGLFARIEFHRDETNSFWMVHSKDGLVSTYGTPQSFTDDAATISDPFNTAHIFAWKLSETRDPFGNRIHYEYERDASAQTYLRRIQYVDLDEPDTGFLVTVDFIYDERPDPFSTGRCGFQLRTTRRCDRIEVSTNAGSSRRVRAYQFVYVDQRPGAELPLNGVSLLSQIHVIGHDDSAANPDDRVQQLPPLELSYSPFSPERRNFIPLSGNSLPAEALSAPDLELVDLFGNGLPDLLEMNGAVRYWRNLGGGRFDLPRIMNEAPAGISFADDGVQLIDADGDGRTDLLVSKPNLSGYYPLRFGGFWDRRSFQRYRIAPSFDLKAKDVQLVDLNGDGVTDAIRSGDRFELYFNDPHEGWAETRRTDRRTLAEFPNVHFEDTRVRWADMNGDGLQDLVMVHDGNVEYWSNLGHGNWGGRVHMRNSPRLPSAYDPRQVLIGDVDGDGAADLVFVDDGHITLWINQSGNGWSDPIEIDGTPRFTNEDDVRLVDLLGTGVSGVLWSLRPLANRRDRGFFLDFTQGAKPYLLARMNNHRGAITEIRYRSSTEEFLRDQARPETRWKTTLPFPVQIVSKVVVHDEFSGGRLTTDYRYHHGYWDGGEREYRGFGCVEVINTETFADYYAPTASDEAGERVPEVHFSPPTLSRSWFHLGPVGDEFGEWEAVNHEDEYWVGDAPFFTAEQSALQQFLAGFDQRRTRRDALRALRGGLIRAELYALDDGDRTDRPYTVTETAYGLREIDEPPDTDLQRRHIFFPHVLAQRTTQWERGDDPLTRLSYTDDYDDYGQARRQLEIACPRGWRSLNENARPATEYLTVFTENFYAQRDDDLFIVDRVAGGSSFQINQPQDSPAPDVTVIQLREDALNNTAPRELFAQRFNYYDGEAYVGLPSGQVGEFGVLVRSEALITTEAILADAYQGDDTSPLPPYLVTNEEIDWPDEYPERFRQSVPPLAGYRFNPGDAQHARGYFVDVTRNRFDFQVGEVTNPRGMLASLLDPMGEETTVEFDEFAFLPVQVTTPAGLTTTAVNDYRLFQPVLVTEPNGNRNVVTFSALGLTTAIAAIGKEDGPAVGDTLETPGTRFEYDLLAYDNSPADNRQPVSVRALRRVHHVNDPDVPLEERDAIIESIEYSDGFGRLLQARTQAEDVLFGDGTFGNNTLTPDQSDLAATQALIAGTVRDASAEPNVVVSGWQVYDNKGQVVQKYEPFFGAGWDYLSLAEAEQLREQGASDLFGQSVRQFYDPRGQVIRLLNGDGSERRVVYGIPTDLTDPDSFIPTPWEAYTYDANDLAPLSHDPDDAPLTAGAPDSHHFTPSSVEIDALGRTIRAVQRLGPSPADEVVTSSRYDIRGNIIAVVDAPGRTAFRYAYDLADQPLSVFSIDAGTRRTVFDAFNNALERRDSKGALVLSTTDNVNRVVDVWARNNSSRQVTLRQHLVYGDDAADFGIDLTGARSRNALGRMVAHFDEAGLLRAGDYDFKGNLLEKTRQVINDEQLLSVFDDGQANDWQISSYQLDWEPPGVTISDRAAEILEPTEYTTTSSYNALNRVREVVYPLDADNERKILRPTYNRAGKLETVSLDDELHVQHIAYNAKGQRSLIAYANSVITRYSYDPRSFRLTRLRSERYTQAAEHNYQPVGPAFQDFAYEYDLVGNVLRIRDRTPASGVPNTLLGVDALDRQFEYDPLYRLISATGRECDIRDPLPLWSDEPRCSDSTLARAYVESYQYDAVGNMLSLAHQNGDGGFTRQFSSTAESNRLETLTVAQTDFSYSYDANGNLTQETTSRHFDWDEEDRLAMYRTQTAGAEPSICGLYLYDSAGQRVKKLVRRQGGNSSSTTYIDGLLEHHHRSELNLISQNDTLHVMDDQQRIALLRAGDPFPDDQLPALQFPLADHLGSSNVTIGANGAVLSRQEYTPYGETSFGGAERQRYQFVGKEREEESGMYCFGNRYYVPWLARFSIPDPMANAHVDLSPYCYANGNPMTYADPSGLDAEEKKGPGSSSNVEAESNTDSLTAKMEYASENGHKLNFYIVERTARGDESLKLGLQSAREAPGVIVIAAKNPTTAGQKIAKIKQQYEKKFGVEPSVGNIFVAYHSSYWKNKGGDYPAYVTIGSTIVLKKFGERNVRFLSKRMATLKRQLDADSKVLLLGCNVAGGEIVNGKSVTIGTYIVDDLADALGVTVYANYSWSISTTNRFNQDTPSDGEMQTLTYGLWSTDEVHEKDVEAYKKKPNAIMMMGLWAKATPDRKERKVENVNEIYLMPSGEFGIASGNWNREHFLMLLRIRMAAEASR